MSDEEIPVIEDGAPIDAGQPNKPKPDPEPDTRSPEARKHDMGPSRPSVTPLHREQPKPAYDPCDGLDPKTLLPKMPTRPPDMTMGAVLTPAPVAEPMRLSMKLTRVAFNVGWPLLSEFVFDIVNSDQPFTDIGSMKVTAPALAFTIGRTYEMTITTRETP